jgi:hypothetical protein
MELQFMNAAEVFNLVQAGKMNDDQFLEWLSYTVQEAYHNGIERGVLEGAEV